MSTKLGRVAERVWTSTPGDLYVLGKRRVGTLFGHRDNGWDYSLDAVLRNPKHMDVKLEIERWERQWRMCRRLGAPELETEFSVLGKTIFELGCGPVLGFGPVAIFLGASAFYYREPDFIRSVFESDAVKQKYFKPLFAELIANYGELQSFNEWYRSVMQKCEPVSDDRELVGITISHSVLEHISREELPTMLAKLYEVAGPSSRFCHTVDFGPHGGSFQDLYQTDKAIERPRLNLYRLSDIISALQAAGFEIYQSITYKRDSIDRSLIHQSWREYSDEDLESRVVLIFGTKKRDTRLEGSKGGAVDGPVSL
jgi:hypothetical protein